jgi:DNA polymerase-3 subunit delta
MLYFLHGDSPPLQIKFQELIQDIKNKNQNIPEKSFDGIDKEDEENFFQNISTMSMFSPLELIIFKRAENLKNLQSFLSGIQKYNVSQKEIVVIYEESLSEYGKIINPLGKKELSLAEELGKVICYRKENEKKAMLLLLQKELNISEGEANKFLEIIGEEYYKVLNEANKVKSYLDGERFDLNKVLPILSVDKEYSLRNLMENFLNKRSYARLLEHLQKEKDYMGFLYMIADELITYLKLDSLMEDKTIYKGINYNTFNSRYDSIKKLFSKPYGQYHHPYTIYSKLDKLGLYKGEFIQNKLDEILNAEYLVKSGSMEEEIAVEVFIESFFEDMK